MSRIDIWTFALTVGLSLGVALPACAQGRGGGVGRVTGGVTGTANGTLNNTVSPPAQIGTHGRSSGGLGVGPGADTALGVTGNAALSTRLQPLLPAGTTLSGAAAGFSNEGEFVSALHVAHNLNIPFDQLKAKMTGDDQASLGKAIQSLRPAMEKEAIKKDAKLAERQAERDLRTASSDGKPDKFATRLSSNTHLSSRLEALLPPGETLATAATGFKNEGQFIAALQVSKNLGIPFADIKDRATAGQSLGEAIHDLKPAMTQEEVNASVRTAEEQSGTIQVQASAEASAKR